MVETVGIVGCGLMGRGLAEAIASHGIPVVAVKARGGDPAPARARIETSLDRRVARGKLTAQERDAILGRIVVTGDFSELAGCDLVIESGLEDTTAKLSLLTRIEAHLSEGAVLATNTSSLPLDTLADALARPAQLVGLHFFNPVPKMKLVEVGATQRTAPGVIAACHALVQRIGKTPIDVNATPGYVVNRLLVPYLLHAIETLEAGVAEAPAIDEAMKLGCGHPMGPLALADFIGLDVVLAMARSLYAETRDRRYRAPSLLRRLVLAGDLGRKTARGIYDYSAEPVPNPAIVVHYPVLTASSDAQ